MTNTLGICKYCYLALLNFVIYRYLTNCIALRQYESISHSSQMHTSVEILICALLYRETCKIVNTSWQNHEVLYVLFYLFKDQDCPRLPDSEGVSIPFILPGKELSQIFLDIRGIDALLWNNVNILHDDTFGDAI